MSIRTRALAVGIAASITAASAADYRHDIEVIDRALDGAKPDDPWVPFGDVGIKYADLRTYRDRLAEGAVAPPGTTFKWPGGNVYYRFDPAQVGNGTITPLKMQQFRDGIAEWAAFANLHFIENVTGQPHSITVQEDPALGGGFSSSVGMDSVNAEQFVRFGPAAWNRGTVCHEIGHALGLFHEQQRPDRDSYVVINWGNIDDALEPNFTVIPNGATYGSPYDFYSVMHYARDALSSNGGDTISMQPAYAAYIDVIGQVSDRTVSKAERAAMAAIYGNPAPLPSSVVTNTKDSGSGSLRAALYFAFDKSTDVPPVPTTITFHIPTSDPGYDAGAGVFRIKPTNLLTALGNGTTIDGASQAAFAGDTNPLGPEIVLDGSIFSQLEGPLGISAPGLTVRAANCVIKGLTIESFNQSGILIFQGTDPEGSAATGNIVGGTTAAERNVISGNRDYGIGIHDAATTGNVIRGNSIGITQAGLAQANLAGVVLYLGAHGNTIAGNVISGNTNHGVYLGDFGTTGNVVQGNLIGTDPAGSAPVPNGVGVGIRLNAQSNTIGGTTAGTGNVISGNVYQGVAIDGAGTAGNVVRGNFIGLAASGTAALANGSAGVSLFDGAQLNSIGGLVAGSRNVISGNAYQGVTLDGTDTSSNTIQGNFIGLDKNGTAAIANGSSGISIYNGATSNTLGGTIPTARNVISGNIYQGVTIDGANTSQNTVQGNYFGLDATGTAAIANGGTPVAVFSGAHDNMIGGLAPGSRNFICGSPDYGLTIDGAGTIHNVVQGNTIGVNVAGAPRPNAYEGVALFGGAQTNVIGGSAFGAGNVIAGNTFEGIALFDGGTNRNAISQNAIFANHFSGILLSGGANNGQPAPALATAVLGAAGNVQGTDVGGSLSASTPSATYRIEFFANPPGEDEARSFIGSASVVTNGSGVASFSSPPVQLASAVPKNYLVTATATDPLGNTSALSATVAVAAVDTDGDGMPDAWETAHSLNPASAADGPTDADVDGFTNLQEFFDGTDPRSAASRLMITVDRLTGVPRISFTAIAGKTYRLESRDDLSNAPWSLLTGPIASATTSTLSIIDGNAGGAGGVAKRSYRVVVEP